MPVPLYRLIADDLSEQIESGPSNTASNSRAKQSCESSTGLHGTRSGMRSSGSSAVAWSRVRQARAAS